MEDILKMFSSQVLVKDCDLGFGDLFLRLLGKCMGVLSTGPKWRAQRKELAPCWRRSAFLDAGTLGEIQATIQQHLQQCWAERPNWPAMDLCRPLTLRLVAGVVFGERIVTKYWAELGELNEAQGRLFQAIFSTGLARYRLYRFLPTALNTELRNFHRNFKELLGRIAVDPDLKPNSAFHHFAGGLQGSSFTEEEVRQRN